MYEHDNKLIARLLIMTNHEHMYCPAVKAIHPLAGATHASTHLSIMKLVSMVCQTYSISQILDRSVLSKTCKLQYWRKNALSGKLVSYCLQRMSVYQAYGEDACDQNNFIQSSSHYPTHSTFSTRNNPFLLGRQVWKWFWPMHLLFVQGSISLKKLPNEWMSKLTA